MKFEINGRIYSISSEDRYSKRNLRINKIPRTTLPLLIIIFSSPMMLLPIFFVIMPCIENAKFLMRQARKRKFTFRATLYKHQPSWKLGCNFKTPKCASDTGRGEDRCTPVITNDAAFYSTLLYYDKTDNSRIFVVHANIDRH